MIDPAVVERQRMAIGLEARPALMLEDSGHICAVCREPIMREPGRKGPPFKTCHRCRAEGYCGAPCRVCGGPRKESDKHRKGKRRGCCASCRKAMPRANQRPHGRTKGAVTSIEIQRQKDIARARRVLAAKGYTQYVEAA